MLQDLVNKINAAYDHEQATFTWGQLVTPPALPDEETGLSFKSACKKLIAAFVKNVVVNNGDTKKTSILAVECFQTTGRFAVTHFHMEEANLFPKQLVIAMENRTPIRQLKQM